MSIPKVDTWFFEKLEFHYPDILSVKLVEGIKSDESEMVLSDTEKPIGPYFPVRVLRTIKTPILILTKINPLLLS